MNKLRQAIFSALPEAIGLRRVPCLWIEKSGYQNLTAGVN